jgi:soluble lytic murein transglycosylase-like protein
LLAHVGLIASIIWAFATLGVAFAGLDARLQAETDQTRELISQAAALKVEVRDLHQYLASDASEDILYLKIMVTKPDVDREVARMVARYVSRYAALHGQDPDLILAIIAVESRFDPKAISAKGAVGLMQVMPQWKQVLGITEDLRDPETNIKYGLQILGFYQQMYKEREMALTAYNRGPGPVDMALMRGQSPTNSYAPRVLQKYDLLKSMKVGKR